MTDPQQFLIYQSEDGATRIDVMLETETLWLSQKRLTELFGKAKLKEYIVKGFVLDDARDIQYRLGHAKWGNLLNRIV